MFDAEEPDVYLACPRRYYYERVLELGGQREDSAYVLFHRCVYAVVRWLGDERRRGEVPKPADALTHLSAIWADQGPVGHAYEALYRKKAAAMVEFAVAHSNGRTSSTPPSREVQL